LRVDTFRILHFTFYIRHFTYVINVDGLVSPLSKMGAENGCKPVRGFFEVMQEKPNRHVQCAKCATRNVFTCTTKIFVRKQQYNVI